MNCQNQLNLGFISGVLSVMQGASELDAYYARSRWLEHPLFRRMDVFLEKYHWQ